MGSRSGDRDYEEAREAFELEEFGLLDPGQPTKLAHKKHEKAMTAEFTGLERRMIRYSLGLGRK